MGEDRQNRTQGCALQSSAAVRLINIDNLENGPIAAREVGPQASRFQVIFIHIGRQPDNSAIASHQGEAEEVLRFGSPVMTISGTLLLARRVSAPASRTSPPICRREKNSEVRAAHGGGARRFEFASSTLG